MIVQEKLDIIFVLSIRILGNVGVPSTENYTAISGVFLDDRRTALYNQFHNQSQSRIMTGLCFLCNKMPQSIENLSDALQSSNDYQQS
jgi:hypothetical protein